MRPARRLWKILFALQSKRADNRNYKECYAFGDQAMKCFSKELQSLGMRLRTMRIRRNESQAILAARLGVSVPTLRKMEGGSSSVLIGHWVAALEILDRVGDLETVLAEPEDLFKRMEQMERPMPLRASRKKS